MTKEKNGKPRIARYEVYKQKPNGELIKGSACILCGRFFAGSRHDASGRAALYYHFKNSKLHWIRKKMIPLVTFFKRD